MVNGTELYAVVRVQERHESVVVGKVMGRTNAEILASDLIEAAKAGGLVATYEVRESSHAGQLPRRGE